jgi:hypothetical protein
MQLFHVASPRHVKVGDLLTTSVPTGVDSVQQQVLEALFPPGGEVSNWGEAMLAEKTVLLGDMAFVDEGLAAVPGVVGATPGTQYDRTLHVSEAGRAAMTNTRNRIIELALELTRRTDNRFLALPSRLTCVFAYETQAAAEDYLRERRPNTDCSLWKIEANDRVAVHRADAGWLIVPRDLLTFVVALTGYWEGKCRLDRPSQPIDFEVLVPPGVATVVEQIQTH